MPRAEILARRKKHSGRGTFDRGDLKEVAGGRYGATIDSLCNEAFAGALIALREGTATLQWDDTRPEDITPAVAVAKGHFVQVGLGPVMPPQATWPYSAPGRVAHAKPPVPAAWKT